jgi:hypothetical protein
MDMDTLHMQRRADFAFLRDALRQLNEAEARGDVAQVRAFRGYVDRCLAGIRAHAHTEPQPAGAPNA